MLGDSEAYSSFAVPDVDEAKRFYTETLGLNVDVLDEQFGLLELHVPGSRDILIYHKPDHVPAPFTVLNFPVEDVEQAVDGLVERGVEFERYEGFEQDERGIARGPGPDVAWFKDPAGNIMAVMTDPA
jgi:catechol 2,3-dioxygenase-like lactoylglutathione lyase family enzyme